MTRHAEKLAKLLELEEIRKGGRTSVLGQEVTPTQVARARAMPRGSPEKAGGYSSDAAKVWLQELGSRGIGELITGRDQRIHYRRPTLTDLAPDVRQKVSAFLKRRRSVIECGNPSDEPPSQVRREDSD